MLVAELGLKAALAGNAASYKDLNGYRHDLLRRAEAVNHACSEIEATSVAARIRMLPMLVDNRYSAQQPSRMETGGIVMICEYNSGAVAQALTGGSFGKDFEATKFD